MVSPYAPGTAYVLLHHYFGEVGGKIGACGHARRGPKALGSRLRSRRRTPGGRREAVPMYRIACGLPPTRRIACAISMGHY